MSAPSRTTVWTSMAFVWRHYRGQVVGSLGLLLLAGLAEGVGIINLLPLLEILVGRDDTAPTALGAQIAAAFEAIGLTPSLTVLLGAVVGGILLKAVLQIGALSHVGYAAAAVAAALRHRLLKGVMAARWGYYTMQPVGTLANAVSGEAMRASGVYGAFCRLLAETAQVALYGVLSLLTSWQVTVAAVLFGAILAVVLQVLMRVVRHASEHQTTALKSLVGRLTNALTGFKPMKAMAAEGHVASLMEAETDVINVSQRREAVAIATFANAHEPLITVFLGIGIFVVATQSTVPIAELLFMAVLFQRMISRISAAQSALQTLERFGPALRSILATTTAAEDAAEHHTGTRAPTLDRGIELRDVTFGYDGKAVLEGVSLRLPARGFVALAGPSGTGKTTIADLVVGLRRPESGEVFVDDVALAEIDLRAWRRLIGYVPQETLLFHGSVLTNVTLDDPTIDRDRALAALRDADAFDFVEALPHGVDTVVGEMGGKLSGGQRQRIAIARGLARSPELLILDEPTAALDPQSAREICNTLHKLGGRLTVLAISHRPAIIDAADHVIDVAAGTLRQRQVEGVGPRKASALT